MKAFLVLASLATLLFSFSASAFDDCRTQPDSACSRQCSRDLCVGDTVINTVRSSAYAQIVGIQADHKFVLRFTTGELAGRTGAGWDRNDLAVLSGCARNGACAGQQFINTTRNAYATIVGLETSGKFVLRFDTGELAGRLGGGWDLNELAWTTGCTRDLCVGARVLNVARSSVEATVVGIEQTHKFVLRFEAGELAGRMGGGWDASDLVCVQPGDANQPYRP